MITLPAAFTKVTGAPTGEILVRARAIENQAFLVAADQIGTHPPDKESFGVDDRRSVGRVLVRAPDEECFIAANLDFARQDEVRDKLPSLANRVAGRIPLARRGDRLMPASVDKRRLILDAAIRVFARQGFHACRVSDIADEAGVAYGLVYPLRVKEEILNTLFFDLA